MNIKWKINNQGIKVKPCAKCKEEFPYTNEFFRKMNSKGKLGAYCYSCEKEEQKQRRIRNKKTDRICVRNIPYEINEVLYKKCNKCENDFPFDDVHFDVSIVNNKKTLKPYCRNCRRQYVKTEKKNNWQRTLLRNAKASTSYKKNLQLDIDENYILDLWKKQNGKCYWFGIDMIPSTVTKNPFQPSLDRLDRNEGYTKGNVVLCCFSANFGRNENSEDSWKEFLISLKTELDYSQWQ